MADARPTHLLLLATVPSMSTPLEVGLQVLLGRHWRSVVVGQVPETDAVVVALHMGLCCPFTALRMFPAQ